ncbi:MAG: hypothetical protein H0X40_07145 [Chthoniobacterales bacterium]|nr:hypothetical protein [Chthoniobacterales bacterium]
MPRWAYNEVTLTDGRVLVAGGFQNRAVNTVQTRSAEIYDPATGRWTLTGSLRTERVDSTANLLQDGEVFAAGGFNSDGASLDSIEKYNPATGRWRLLTNTLSEPRYEHTGTTLLDGSVLLAGGVSFGDYVRQSERFLQP